LSSFRKRRQMSPHKRACRHSLLDSRLSRKLHHYPQREPRVRALLGARTIIDRDVKIEHARIAHSERLYGCGLYLEPAQYGCGLYLEPAQYGCGLYLEPAQYGCGLYLEPAQYGCGLYLEPAQYGCGLYLEPVQ